MPRDIPNRHYPEYWCLIADKARAVVDGLTAEANRRLMLEAAEAYERLGEQARLEEYDWR